MRLIGHVLIKKGCIIILDNLYWKYNPNSFVAVEAKYPKLIKNWYGLPNDISAALQYKNGHTYFFKGGKYWRFDDANFQVSFLNSNFGKHGPWFNYLSYEVSSFHLNFGMTQSWNYFPSFII